MRYWVRVRLDESRYLIYDYNGHDDSDDEVFDITEFFQSNINETNKFF